jgi:hypothetical protein
MGRVAGVLLIASICGFHPTQGSDDPLRTAAAHHGCGSAAKPISTVPPMMLDDGVIDCCDGSDEHFAPLDAENPPLALNCTAAAHRIARFLSRLAKVHEAGWQRGRAALSEAVADVDSARLIQSIHQNAERKKQAFETSAAKFQALEKRARTSSRHAQMSLMASLQQAHAAAGAALLQANAAARQLAAVQTGGDVVLALLGAPCALSEAVSEKDSKGGSSTSLPKAYTYASCFATNASQIEHLPDEWVRLDAATKGAATASEAGVASSEMVVTATGAFGEGAALRDAPHGAAAVASPPLNRTFAQPTHLGDWLGFLPLTQLADAFDAGIVGFHGARPSAQDVLAGVHAGDSTAVRGVSAAWPQGAELHALVSLHLGRDLCRSEDMEAPRRVFVLHVCPGAPLPGEEERRYIAALPRGAHSGGAALLRSATFAPEAGGGGRFSPVQWNSAATLLQEGGNALLTGVVHVEEDGLCAYKLYVATPLACSRHVARAARQEAAALRGEYKSAEKEGRGFSG